MAYRGEDLDLRVSPGRGSRETVGTSEYGINGTRPRTPLASGRPDPVTIDDTVMACCNHAYDIAQAHGANEVRLEHLVHALTRVEAAADILEERGIREAHLRRESAAVIASEIPVGLAHSQSAPRASAEFEDVLRRASDQAAGQPGSRGATVHDLLWVLLNYNREIPAIALLLRHAAGWQSWDWPNRPNVRDEPRRRETVRAADRPMDRIVERRPPPRADVRSEPRERMSASSAYSSMDAVQARLDQMDQSIRALHNEVAADRLQSLEKSVAGSLQEGTRYWGVIGDRLKSIDQTVAGGSTSGLADLVTGELVAVTDQVRQVTQRIDMLERNIETRQADGQRLMNGIGERLRNLDEQLSAARREQQAPAIVQALKGQLDQSRLDLTSAMGQVVEPLANRVQALERSMERRQSESGQLVQALVERVGGFDGALQTQAEATKADFGDMQDALVKLGANQQTLAGNLEQWRMESGGDLGIISNRLELLERGSAQPLEMLTQLQTDMQALQQVALADYDHNRRGFKNWLFGTDDVFAGSWRDDTSALRMRLKQVRDAARRA
jgi:hypothetical protein